MHSNKGEDMDLLEKYLTEATNDDLNVKEIVDDCLQKIAHINVGLRGEDRELQKSVLTLFKDIEKALRNYNRKVF